MAGQEIRELSLGMQWTTTVTYSFVDAFPGYYTSGDQAKVGNVSGLSDAQKQVIANLLGYIQTITGITFQAIDPASGSVGSITFGAGSNISQAEPGVTFTAGIGQSGTGGDVWFRPGMDIAVFAVTALHEIGHALGLKHPNAGADVIQSPPYLSSQETYYSYSIMSTGETTSEYANLPRIPVFGLYDVSELQRLYGAGTANSGDTTYSFSSPTRATIWDASGEDTLSAMSASRGALINLNQTKFSSIINDQEFGPDSPANNIAIAFGAVIENAVGSTSSDIIIGNSSKNKIDGRDGDDLIFGDEVVAKQVIADGPYRDFQIDEQTFWFKGTYQIDGTTSSDDNDKIRGGAGADWIYGGNGDDELTGGAGNDFLDGGVGTDTAIYDDATGAQTLRIETGALPDGARADGSGGFLRVTRGSEVDVLHSIEKLRLSDQADTVEIAAGADLTGLKEIDGGSNPTGANAGVDTLDLSKLGPGYSINNSAIVGTGDNEGVNVHILNFEQIIGLSSNDTINLGETSPLIIHGGAGNDTITGTTRSATLFGDDGNDTLIAGSAGDILDGGGGTGNGSGPSDGDLYFGGDGADTFVIGNGVHAREGTDSFFTIENVDANDRLVLRLSATKSDASAWTKGIILNGGVNPVPPGDETNEVHAIFSPTIVNPTISSGGDGAIVATLSLQDTRTDLGKFLVFYDLNQAASQLYVTIISAYGDFNILVNDFQDGDLGLTFTNTPYPYNSDFQGSVSAGILQNEWGAYNGAMTAKSQSVTLIDLTSPGTPTTGSAEPWQPGTIPSGVETRNLPKFIPTDDLFGLFDRFNPPPNEVVSAATIDNHVSQLVQAMATYSSPFSSAETFTPAEPINKTWQTTLAAAA